MYSFYQEDPCLPVYQWTKRDEHFSIESIAKIILCNSVSKDKICSQQPLRVCHNVTFVVSLFSLADAHDIRADENGVWKRKGSPVAYVSIHMNSGISQVLKRPKLGDFPHHFKLTRTYYRHSSSPDFTRIITTAHSKYINLPLLLLCFLGWLSGFGNIVEPCNHALHMHAATLLQAACMHACMMWVGSAPFVGMLLLPMHISL